MLLEDQKFQQMKIRKNLSKARIKTYKQTFQDMYELTNKTPSQLINEAKEEQQPYIKDNKIVFPDVEDRKVTKYLYSYYNHLKNNGLKTSAILVYISALRAFYTEYRVELPKNFSNESQKEIIREGDIPNIEDIRKAIESTNNTRNKAIILLMASSGIRGVDLRNFKVSDFTEATKEYHNSNKIDDLLDTKSNNIIPTWYFMPQKTKKKGNICITFNTPECSEWIINYLKIRDNLTESSYLFESRQKKKLSAQSLITILKRINDDLFGKSRNNKRFLRPHSLRKFFITTCNHNANDLTKVNILSGHSSRSSVHDAYNEVNTGVMKRFYTRLIPYLSIRDTKVHNVESDDYLRLEKELKETNKKLMKAEKEKENFKKEILAELKKELLKS